MGVCCSVTDLVMNPRVVRSFTTAEDRLLVRSRIAQGKVMTCSLQLANALNFSKFKPRRFFLLSLSRISLRTSSCRRFWARSCQSTLVTSPTSTLVLAMFSKLQPSGSGTRWCLLGFTGETANATSELLHLVILLTGFVPLGGTQTWVIYSSHIIFVNLCKFVGYYEP